MKKDLKYIVRRALLTGMGAFFLAMVVSLAAKGILEGVTSILVAVTLLGIIVFLGILLDVVGTAVTAANEQIFHAMSAKKIPGATQGAYLVRNADQVANICNDVVGDVSSAISGALGAGLALLVVRQGTGGILPETIITACIAGTTVGGKALGKTFAIRRADRIIFFTGRLLERFRIRLELRGRS